MEKEYLPEILPCPCGKKPTIATMLPDGRTRYVYRIICDCGNSPLQWSVSKSSAIRLWNAFIATK